MPRRGREQSNGNRSAGLTTSVPVGEGEGEGGGRVRVRAGRGGGRSDVARSEWPRASRGRRLGPVLGFRAMGWAGGSDWTRCAMGWAGGE